MTTPIPVVAAVIERDGRYLLGRRPAHKRHGDLWEFPGGKMEAGETWLAAAHRELAEELGMVGVRARSLLMTVRDEGSPFAIHFVEIEAGGEPVPTEHTEVGWFTVAELLEMHLAPADAAFVSRLRAER